MLEEKLEQESRAVRRRRLQLVVGAALSVVVLALAYGGILLIRDTGGDGPARVAKTPAEAVAPAPLPQPAAPVAVPEPVDAAAIEAARESFKTSLAAFQAEIEPNVVHDDFARWDVIAQRRILDAKDAAIADFGAANYADATDALAAVQADAEAVLAARDRAFEDAFAAAGAAFAADNYDSALAAIDRALEIRPESAPAVALKERIDNLPVLLETIEAAAVARVENNLAAEERHLAAALEIDPNRNELAPRLEEVRRLLREAAFAGHIADGLARVDTRDLAAAKRSLAAARKIYTNRPEIDVLDEKIAALQIELTIERLTRTARAAAAADDWPAAERTYIEVRRLAPVARDITNELARAQAINGLDARAARHLASPERLASEAVAADASAVANDIAAYRGDSPRLASKADELAALVAAYGVKVPVRIVSDGETDISVRGVGIVGKVTDRTIELRPGRYTFEGIRAGFQAVLMRVDIPPGRTGLVLEIVPDERI